jgi:hypothetical protein
MRLSFQSPTGELKTVSRINPDSEAYRDKAAIHGLISDMKIEGRTNPDSEAYRDKEAIHGLISEMKIDGRT